MVSLFTRLLSMAALLSAAQAHGGVVFTNLHSFSVFSEGLSPSGALVQGKDGNIYGTAFSGGDTNAPTQESGYGTLFRITPSEAFTCLYSFTNGADGAHPNALILASDGNFYGTSAGGEFQNLYGTIFKTSADGALTGLYSFSDPHNNVPNGLVQGKDGFLYGTCIGLYSLDTGAIFKISTSGEFTLLCTLPGSAQLKPNGLIQGADGNLYGTTQSGPTFGPGTVFKVSTNGAFTFLYSFTGTNANLSGEFPLTGLVQGGDGYFYGTTYSGGPIGDGTVFKISPDGVLTTLHFFNRTNEGAGPISLIQGRDGNLYGTTGYGIGYTRTGSVFQITTNGLFTTLYFFTGGTDGSWPNGLIQADDGNLYGTTGATLFRLSITPTAPTFLPVTFTNNLLYLTWSTEAGGKYQLQYLSELNSSNWTNLGVPLTADGTTLSTTDLSEGQTRFYRLVRFP